MSAAQIPSVGRIVHYASARSDRAHTQHCRAAIVTCTHDDNVVDLFVLTDTLFFHSRGVHNDEVNTELGGTWHWPERVGE